MEMWTRRCRLLTLEVLALVIIGIVMIALCGIWAYVRHVRAIMKLESPGQAAKADAAIVKEFADEF